jgi:hypothetical protein
MTGVPLTRRYHRPIELALMPHVALLATAGAARLRRLSGHFRLRCAQAELFPQLLKPKQTLRHSWGNEIMGTGALAWLPGGCRKITIRQSDRDSVRP